MKNEDKVSFKLMLDSVCKLYGRPHMEQADIKLWWYKLVGFEYQDVGRSFDRWTSNKAFMPTPFDIISDLRRNVELKKQNVFLLAKPIDREKGKLAIEKLKAKFKWK